ncbi:MAG: amidase [Rhodospirillaceae bacterium]|jgi:amidase|nr:amidase [Rhodospirillaceae bacterium]
MPADLTRRSAFEIAAALRARDVSAVEVLEAHLGVIDHLNPRLNAIVTLAADAARETARAADALIAAGSENLPPLLGLPVVIKDIVETAGIRTTWASPVYADHVPEEDAEVVARLRSAGAIILGKSNTPEFAAGANTDNELFGPTGNPWDPVLSPSGSSGGSAAAVASGMVPIAQGTDFGCSLRMPAAFCGIVGLRTTPGLISNYPLPLPWDSGQVLGPMARSAEDAAMMLDAMAGYSEKMPNSVLAPWSSALEIVRGREDAKGLRLAYAPDIAAIGVDAELEGICRKAALGLAGDGAIVEEIDFDLSDARDAYLTLRGEWMVGMQYERLDNLDAFGPNLAGNVRSGLGTTMQELAAAEDMRTRVWHRYRKLFETYDALLMPMSPVQQFPVKQNFPDSIGGRKLENYVDWIAGAFLVTMAGIPAGSIPAGLTQAGLPVGLQIAAPRFAEPLILSLGKLLQRANPIGWPAWADSH